MRIGLARKKRRLGLCLPHALEFIENPSQVLRVGCLESLPRSDNIGNLLGLGRNKRRAPGETELCLQRRVVLLQHSALLKLGRQLLGAELVDGLNLVGARLHVVDGWAIGKPGDGLLDPGEEVCGHSLVLRNEALVLTVRLKHRRNLLCRCLGLVQEGVSESVRG